MPEEEEVEANMKEIAEKASENKKINSMPDVCETPPSSGGPVPIPYPNTAMSSDTSSGSKKVKIEGKEVIMTKKSSFEESTGDEPGSSGWKSITNVVKRATGSKVLNVPLWVWSVGVAILLLAVWILVTGNPQPSEPIEQYIIELIAASK
jgi:hypothetical protein